MIEILAVLGIPLLGAALLAAIGERDIAATINVAASFVTLLAAAALTVRVLVDGPLLVLDRQFFVDPFNVFLVALTAFVGFTTSLFSRPYMRIEKEHGKLTAGRLRLYHSMYQLFNFTMLLALLTNNMGILWVAMEGATLATVLLVSLYRTPASLEAAWKYFILCGVGIAQALFGTILLYFAAEKLLGAEGGALLWTGLNDVKGQLEPTVLSIAFVFLLVGYGTKVGLVPLHNWLPDAHAEGPTPVSAVLSGLLLNVALYAVVRCKVLVEGLVAQRVRARADDGLRPAVGRGRRAASLAAEGREAALRVLVDRAHGNHHVRFRHGRPGRQLRGPAAHDRPFAHQVRDLLHGRPCGAEGRNAVDGRDPRPRHDESRCSAGASCSARWRFSACRRSASSRASS